MRRNQRKELHNISVNLDTSIRSARGGLPLIRDGPQVDSQAAADFLEIFINEVEQQNQRLHNAID